VRLGIARRAISILLLIVPTCALGAEGIYLTWNDCALGGRAAPNISSACTDAGAETLYCAFTLPQALDSVIAVEVVVDIQHSASTMPAWWQLGPGGCRDLVLDPSAVFSGSSSCVDFWQGDATSDPLPFVYTIGSPHGQQNQARLVISAALPSSLQRSLNATDMYYAARIIVPNLRSSSCSGCSGSACLVLNSILIGRRPGAVGGDRFLQVPGAGGANHATWQGAGADCSAVPVRRVSWGTLKSLYR
jgi:hypothetical protein